MKEKHRQLLIGDISMRGMALYTMACRHLPAFIDKKWCLLVEDLRWGGPRADRL